MALSPGRPLGGRDASSRATRVIDRRFHEPARAAFSAVPLAALLLCTGPTVARPGIADPVAAPRAAPQTAAPSGTLVVSNMNDNTATVLDAGSGRVIATLPTGEGPHEVAIAHSGRWAAVSNYGVRGKPGSTVTVIDVARAEVARTLALTGYQRPHGMAFLPGDTLLAVTSETSRAVLLVDFRDGRVVAVLPTNGRTSHMVAVPARGDRLFTANIADGTVSAIGLAPADSARVIAVGRQPEGIAVTPDGNTVWAGSNRDSIVVVVDTRKRVAVDTLRGFGLPYRMAFTPDGRRRSSPIPCAPRSACSTRPTAV